MSPWRDVRNLRKKKNNKKKKQKKKTHTHTHTHKKTTTKNKKKKKKKNSGVIWTYARVTAEDANHNAINPMQLYVAKLKYFTIFTMGFKILWELIEHAPICKNLKLY